ncbi:hypothetical protein [Robiginitomaculum antarcticum]|uniref:hypothetical protein n=1 Tax=Robiginitomaculum antarcticum TaxID=437507 RepID=UPI0003797CC3|nr:hypothetical protein [Robiginitomaculum antarcticum]
MENKNQFVICWSKVLLKLDLEVIEVSTQKLGIKTNLDVLPLLKNFGGKNGMLLFPDGSMVLQHHQILSEQGFGYSVTSCPKSADESLELFLISMLKDWTWTGAQSEKPEWL